MNVNEIMTKNPACCGADENLQKVAEMMVTNDCGCIPVCESGPDSKVIGVLTDRDIVTRAVAAGKNPLDLKASDVMTRDAVTVTPNSSIEDCCSLMEERQIRRVVVVDEKGCCAGIVAQADIANKSDGHRTAEVVQEVSKASA